MEIVFYTKKHSEKCPVKEFIESLEVIERAKVLACLKSIEELGFGSPRVQFRHIRGRLWEIKIWAVNSGIRIFYASIKSNTIILLHAYKKQAQKAPGKEIQTAEIRLEEVENNEKDYA